MKIKDITISIFAIIGFVAILSSFNNQTHDTVPESHIWEYLQPAGTVDSSVKYLLNKKTGELRVHRLVHSETKDPKRWEGYSITHIDSEPRE